MTSRFLVSRLMLMSVSIALGIGWIVTDQLLASRAAILDHARTTSQNILFAVNHVLGNTLRDLDLSLLDTIDRIDQTARGNDRLSSMQGSARSLHLLAPGDLGNELVIDADGEVTHSAKPLPPGNWSFNTRDYFLFHQQGNGTGLFVSEPFYSKLDGKVSVAFSRRWNKPDGTFGGVVVVTIKLQYFTGLFSAIELGTAGGINLFFTNGTLLTRFPYNDDLLGTSLAGQPNFQRFLREGRGSFIGASDIDGIERLYTFGGLDPFPMLVSIVRSTDVILEAWYRDVRRLGAATLALMVACIALALLAERQLYARHLATAQMQQAKNHLHTVLDSIPAMVAYWDSNLRNRFSNSAHSDWFGMKPQQIDGRVMSDVMCTQVLAELEPHIYLALDGHRQQFDNVLPDANGDRRHVASTYIPDIRQDGVVRGFFVLATDTTQRKAIETSLLEEKERFRVTLESIRDGVITTDKDGRITYQNPAAEAMTGWASDEAIGRLAEDVIALHDDTEGAAQQSSLRQALSFRHAIISTNDSVLINRNGQRIEVDDSAAPILDETGMLSGAVLVFHDVSRSRALAREMQHLSQHDALTRLPNRRMLGDSSNKAITRAKRDRRRIAVLYLDLDGFKNVNDTYGHDAGDELLVIVAQRFSSVLRVGDMLTRYGGDEFIVLMDVLDGPEDAARLAARLLAVNNEPIVIKGQRLVIGTSIGIALYPDDAQDFEGLLRHADKSMYEAKRGGKNRYSLSA
ncbi:MAG TPA: diguanylate cyclase [Candidimonas sp.]|nr:diguanylate cyclase [Candidimonas sp.]